MATRAQRNQRNKDVDKNPETESPPAEGSESNAEGSAPEEAASDLLPEAEPPADRIVIALREPFVYHLAGMKHSAEAGQRFSSFDFDLNLFERLGAQMDVIDPDSGEVLCDYADLQE